VPSSRLRTPWAARSTGLSDERPTDHEPLHVGPPAERRVRDSDDDPVDVDDGLPGAVTGEALLERGRRGLAREAGDVDAVDHDARVDAALVLALVGEEGAGSEADRQHEAGDDRERELSEWEAAAAGGVVRRGHRGENLPAPGNRGRAAVAPAPVVPVSRPSG
jgi:hypothetical protein